MSAIVRRSIFEYWASQALQDWPNATTPCATIYNNYLENHPQPEFYLDIAQFGRMMNKLFPNRKARRGTYPQYYVYENVWLKNRELCVSSILQKGKSDKAGETARRKSICRYWINNHIRRKKGVMIRLEKLAEVYNSDHPEAPQPVKQIYLLMRSKFPAQSRIHNEERVFIALEYSREKITVLEKIISNEVFKPKIIICSLGRRTVMENTENTEIPIPKVNMVYKLERPNSNVLFMSNVTLQEGESNGALSKRSLQSSDVPLDLSSKTGM
ncbi:unnamed protein product [Meganyctiphanes norvegica]|uniref:Uncharacterized protein n=1 Tax=Meganyctiphanes norvegica TaxID=48144 RepID=A0AAV2RYK5_MEGNR